MKLLTSLCLKLIILSCHDPKLANTFLPTEVKHSTQYETVYEILVVLELSKNKANNFNKLNTVHENNNVI